MKTTKKQRVYFCTTPGLLVAGVEKKGKEHSLRSLAAKVA